MKIEHTPWWRDVWWYVKHGVAWGGYEPAPYVWIGPFLVTWSKYNVWRTINVSFMPD